MSTTEPAARRPLPSMFRVAWLVVAFGVRRTMNRLAAVTRKKKKPGAGRSATARKRPAGTILVFFFSIVLPFNGLIQSTRLVHHVVTAAQRRHESVALVDRSTMEWVNWASQAAKKERAGQEHASDWREKLERAFAGQVRRDRTPDEAERETRTEQLIRLFDERGRAGFREMPAPSTMFWPSSRLWYRGPGSSDMLATLGFVALLLSVAAVLLGISANQDLAKVEWTFEWWFTFPVPARGLFLARVLETALVNPFTWFFVFPFFFVVFWCSGYSWFSLLLGLASTTYVGLLAGSARVVAETGLRRFLSLRAVARVQALLSIIAFLALGAAVATGSPDWLETMSRFAGRLPRWALINPLFPIGIAAGGSQAWTAALGSTFFAFVAVMSACAVGGFMVRDGLTTSAGPNQGRRGRAPRIRERRGIMLGAVARKELRLIFRDRTVFAQTFILPALLVGTQLIMSRGLLSAIAANPRHASALAFGTAAFTLSMGACNTLVMDVPALWLYYTVPKSLAALLIDKAFVWAGVASLIAVSVFVLVLRASPAALLAGAPAFSLCFVGVLLNAFIATGIGVLATDALETEPRRRIQLSMVYLYMLLASTFAYALYVPSAWAKFTQIVLSALLAYALWQKVRDHTPFLLDPTEAPPPRLAVADGVIAALAFFVLQGILTLGFHLFGYSPGASLLFAFTGAGLSIGAATLFVFWRIRIPGLWATLGLQAPPAGFARGLLTGLAGGLLGGLLARGYLTLVDHIEILRALRDETVSLSPDDMASGKVALLALAIVAAPVFEEFIFRAVLYGGFRRSLGPLRAAIASALVFAIVHPAISSPPVFVLGFIAALVYERSRSLLAPIAAHMTYNACVVGAAFLHQG